MTSRQRRLHQRLREEAPSLYPEVEKALATVPVGYSAKIRLPTRFEDISWFQDPFGPAFIATKTNRGIEYVEDFVPTRKGWTRPRPRLLPMGVA